MLVIDGDRGGFCEGLDHTIMLLQGAGADSVKAFRPGRSSSAGDVRSGA